MDTPKPVKLPKNYYLTHFFKDSKYFFLEQIKAKCSDKEDVTICIEKYGKAFDSVFQHLKTKLEKEDRAAYIFDKRIYNQEGNTYLRWMNIPTGYENWG